MPGARVDLGRDRQAPPRRRAKFRPRDVLRRSAIGSGDCVAWSCTSAVRLLHAVRGRPRDSRVGSRGCDRRSRESMVHARGGRRYLVHSVATTQPAIHAGSARSRDWPSGRRRFAVDLHDPPHRVGCAERFCAGRVARRALGHARGAFGCRVGQPQAGVAPGLGCPRERRAENVPLLLHHTHTIRPRHPSSGNRNAGRVQQLAV